MMAAATAGVFHTCSSCGEKGAADNRVTKLRVFVLWSNERVGVSVRHVCHNCGRIEVITNKYGFAVTRRVLTITAERY